MDDLKRISPVPTVRPSGPTSPVRTLGEAKPKAANDADPPAAPEEAEAEETRRPRLKLTPSAGAKAYELAPAMQGEPYPRLSLEVSGGNGPYRFRVIRRRSSFEMARAGLPAGVKLSEDGVLSGAPRRAGVFRFTVEVRDADGEIGRASYALPVRLDLTRYKAAADPLPGKDGAKRRRPISHFDPEEMDEDGQPVLPLALAEFLAYKSAQAYLGDDPLDPGNSLERAISRSPLKSAVRRYAYFDSAKPLRRYSEAALKKKGKSPYNKAPEHWDDLSAARVEQLNEWRSGLGVTAFGFLFEGRAFIICRGSAALRDWRLNVQNGLTTDPVQPSSWWENVKFRTGLRGRKIRMSEAEMLLIGGPDPERYLKPARAIGFAAGWAALRDQIENWVKTLPADGKREFVFSGHGVGGAIAQIGAQEFADKQGRKIHAVITFGAPCVGKSAESAGPEADGEEQFVDSYRKLHNGELSRRTLRIEAPGDAVPKLLQTKGFAPVGRLWELEFEALPSSAALFWRRCLTGPLLWLARGDLGYGDKALNDLPRKALGYAAFYGGWITSAPVGAGGALHQYAHYLSSLTYRKIRQQRLGDLDGEEALEALRKSGDALEDHYFLANALYDRHLSLVYGPKAQRRYKPHFVCSAAEEARLAERHYGPKRARYLF